MKNYLIVLLSLALFCGCVTSHYRNGIPDATPIATDVSVSELSARNGIFRVFKVNGKIALLRKGASQNGGGKSDSLMTMLNSLLILDNNQLAEMREFCKSVAEYDEGRQTDGVKIIKYNLVANEESVAENVSAAAIGNNVFVTGRQYAYHHSYLDIQYLCQRTKKGRTKVSVSYRWQGGKPERISKQTIIDILADISQ